MMVHVKHTYLASHTHILDVETPSRPCVSFAITLLIILSTYTIKMYGFDDLFRFCFRFRFRFRFRFVSVSFHLPVTTLPGDICCVGANLDSGPSLDWTHGLDCGLVFGLGFGLKQNS